MNNDFIPPSDPWALLSEWYEAALKAEASYPDAMALATVSTEGMPTVRTVLMKEYDENGLVFYTNRESRKGHELAAASKAGICFYWKSLQRQIRLDGTIEAVSDEESNAYFATRPRGSQIGAWASQQSRPLTDRATLEQRVQELTAQFEGQTVPRPPYWGGYRLIPSMFEFWQERDFRLHDRITYQRITSGWTIGRIYP